MAVEESELIRIESSSASLIVAYITHFEFFIVSRKTKMRPVHLSFGTGTK